MTIKTNDYLLMPSKTPDQLIKVIKTLTIFGIRYPSLPDNKIFLG